MLYAFEKEFACVHFVLHFKQPYYTLGWVWSIGRYMKY
jgi:hypothetical protein